MAVMSDLQGRGVIIAVSLTTLGQSQALDALMIWNADFLQELLKKMIAVRGGILTDRDVDQIEKLQLESDPNQTILDEVKDYVILPPNPSNYAMETETVERRKVLTTTWRSVAGSVSSLSVDEGSNAGRVLREGGEE
jgi:hypothetical protein